MEQGCAVHEDELEWFTWDDPELAARSPVRWKLLFTAPRTPSSGLSCGIAEVPPGASLLLHHHGPTEVYYALDGEAIVEIEGTSHRAVAGTALFIPADARHRTTTRGSKPFRLLFVFPTDSFEEVVYHFDE